MLCCIGELAQFVMNLKFDHVYVDVGNVNNLMKTGGKPVSSSLSSLSALSMLGSSSNALFRLCFGLASCVTSFFRIHIIKCLMFHFSPCLKHPH